MANQDDMPRKWGVAMSVGAVLLSNILGGTALGYFADKWFGSAPYGLVFGIVLGTFSAFLALYRVMKKLQ